MLLCNLGGILSVLGRFGVFLSTFCAAVRAAIRVADFRTSQRATFLNCTGMARAGRVIPDLIAKENR